MPVARRLVSLAAVLGVTLGILAVPAAAETEEVAARAVVAAIDTGMNPYHEFFHAGGDGPYAEAGPAAVTPELLEELGIGDDQIIRLTRTGSWRSDVAADDHQWAAVQRGVPYWFEGTNVIGISFAGGSLPPLRPHRDKSAHGVGVTASVLEANPEAVVVMVEGTGSASEQWAMTHPAVDIVTTSYGPPGSPPLPWHLSNSYTGVVTNGKLHFGAVDNSPGLSPLDTTGGPWWSIGVAGFQEDGSGGRQMVSGTAADFVGNFTQSVPYCMDCETGRSSVSGTSFATPTSAGVASAGLLAARRAAGHRGGIVTDGVEQPAMVTGPSPLTNWQVRRALEEAAAYPSHEEFAPGGGTFDLTSAPVPGPAPWALTGWGLLTADPQRQVISELTARLGAGGEPTRSKGAEACAFMTGLIETRMAYWNTYAFMGESWMTDEDPYLRCS
jgi:hypothetical protein